MHPTFSPVQPAALLNEDVHYKENSIPIPQHHTIVKSDTTA